MNPCKSAPSGGYSSSVSCSAPNWPSPPSGTNCARGPKPSVPLRHKLSTCRRRRATGLRRTDARTALHETRNPFSGTQAPRILIAGLLSDYRGRRHEHESTSTRHEPTSPRASPYRASVVQASVVQASVVQASVVQASVAVVCTSVDDRAHVERRITVRTNDVSTGTRDVKISL